MPKPSLLPASAPGEITIKNHLTAQEHIKPIIFSTPMVRAILAGTKTQTRRVIKPQPTGDTFLGVCHDDNNGKVCFSKNCRITDYVKPPYQPGDVLWVRETWQYAGCVGCDKGKNPCSDTCVYVHGTSTTPKPLEFIYKANPVWDKPDGGWKPSIYMPREAARIFLKVTDVRVERLQEITYGDCVREGITRGAGSFIRQDMRKMYAELWDSLNAKRGYPWDSNPYVFVISFEKTEAV